MNRACRGNTTRLIALMSGSLRPGAADRLRRHVDGCPGCKEALERLTRARELCREIGEGEPPSLPWRKVEAQVHWRLARAQGEQSRPLLSPLGRRLVGLGAAAALGALATLAVVWLQRPEKPLPPATRAVLVQPPAPAPLPPEHELAAVPTMVQGEVFVEGADGQRSPLRLDQPVLPGSRVVTAKGRAALQWAEESGLLIAEQSTLALRRLMSRTQRLELEQGRVRLKLAKLTPAQSFVVVARGVRATVKGTVFDVSIDERNVGVDVFEGVVHVDPVDGGWPGLDVPAGYSVRVPIGGGAAPSLVRLEGGETNPRVHLVPWPNLARMMATTGLLTVESQPAADLVLDEVAVGSTNLTLRGSPGRHLVELYRDGKLVEKRWVEVARAEPASVRLIPGRVPRLPPRIHDYIRQRAVQIRACYERLLKRDPTVEGRLTFRFSIDADGAVTKSSLITDTFSDPRVGLCAQRVLDQWRFPPGNEVQVVYPFIFKPQ